MKLLERRNVLSKQAILSHDLGTTGNKASLYGCDGRLLASTYVEYQTYYPHSDWVVQNPEDWWKAVCESTKTVIQKAGIPSGDIAGVSFSGQMMSLIPVGTDGSSISDRVMIWADCRSVEEGRSIEERIGWERFYRRTGAGMAIPLYALAKMMWIKAHQPDVYKSTYKMIGVKDFIVCKLTGEFLTDYSDASNTGLLNLEKRRWDDEIINASGLDSGKLPERICRSTDIVGNVTSSAAAATGLMEGTPVVIGGGDVPSAALGAGVIAEGNAYNVIGSASWLAVASKKPFFDNVMRPFSLCHVVPDTHVVQLAMFSAGVVHQWVKDQFCENEIREAEESGGSVYSIIDKKAEASPAGSNGIVFLPNMRPGGAPHNNLDDRGTIAGLTLAHTKGDILRSVMEGISMNIRIMCEVMENQVGTRFDRINMIGGGSKSEVWRNIQASVMNRTICTLNAQQEANSLGAAIVCGVGLGVFDGFDSAVRDFIKIKECIEPREKDTAVYNDLYGVFNDLYRAVSPINTQLKKIFSAEK